MQKSKVICPVNHMVKTTGEVRPTKISSKSKQIASAIADMSSDLGISPVDIRYNQFIKFLREERELKDSDINKIRSHIQHCGGFLRFRDAFFCGVSTPEVIEGVELSEMAKLSRDATKQLAINDIFVTRFSNKIEKLFSKHRSFFTYPRSSKKQQSSKKQKTKGKKDERVVFLSLNDTHFGSSMDPRELPVKYTFKEEARALASIIEKTCAFKRDYRDVSSLIVCLNGDLIAGKIHDKQSNLAMAEQSADAVWLLTQAIRWLSKEWKKVDVYCVSGNHDRDESRSPDRQVHEKWDSRGTAIAVAIKNAFRWEDSNVTVHIPRTPYNDIKVLGHRIYTTHGDTEFMVGNPGTSVNTGTIAKQVTAINLAEVQSGNKPYDVFVLAHAHQGMRLPLSAAEIVVSPALCPIDGYARSIGIPLSRMGQCLFEITAEHPCGDLRWLWVQKEDLKNKKYDDGIIPFSDF